MHNTIQFRHKAGTGHINQHRKKQVDLVGLTWNWFRPNLSVLICTVTAVWSSERLPAKLQTVSVQIGILVFPIDIFFCFFCFLFIRSERLRYKIKQLSVVLGKLCKYCFWVGVVWANQILDLFVSDHFISWEKPNCNLFLWNSDNQEIQCLTAARALICFVWKSILVEKSAVWYHRKITTHSRANDGIAPGTGASDPSTPT